MDYQFKTRPYKHQIEYLEVASGRTAFAAFAEMGTGKSKMLIDEFAILHEQGRVDSVLITTGKGNYRTWVDEIDRHLPDRIDRLVHLWDGRDNQQTRDERRRLLEYSGLRILIVNIEAIATSTRARMLARLFLSASKRREIVVDESTLIKGHDTIRTGEMCRLAGASEYRRIASGNPSPNTPMDLWGQFLFLGRGGGGMLGFNSYFAFRARYAILQQQYIGNGRTVQVPVAFRNLGELSERVGAHSFRVKKEDCLDLPDKIYEMRQVDLTPEQRRIYDDLRRVAIAELDGAATVSSTMVIGQLSKMHQVLCGQVIDDSGEEREIASNRLSALQEVIEESGKQTIVWCAYRANVRAVTRELRRAYGDPSVVEYYGPTKPDDRELAIRRFQDGSAHFFVGTPHSGARGITLTAAKTVVYFSNSFDLEHRVQSEDRAHRIGQTAPVTYVDLAVPGTLDMRIIQALRKKINISSQIMRDGYREWVI